MKFGLLFEELLNELSGDEIYKTYYSGVPFNTFKKIVSADPQTIIKRNQVNGQAVRKIEIKKLGRYSKVLLSMWKSGNLKLEDLPKAGEYLTYAYKHGVPIDINKVKTLADMYELVKKYIIRGTNDYDKIISSLPTNEYATVFDGKQWKIMIPKTEKAACTLGVGTEWCTTWGKLSLNQDNKERTNYFNHYDKQGKLYIIVNKNNPKEKYQFHFENDQFMNSEDNAINTGDFLNKNPEIRNYFFPSFIGEVSKDEMKREIGIMSVLSGDDSKELIKKFVDGDDNPLVEAILSANSEVLFHYIKDDNLESIDVADEIVNIEVSKLKGEVEMVKNVLSYYEGEKQQAYERVWNDFNESGIEWDWETELIGIFKEYFDANISMLTEYLGVRDFETFKHFYYDNFIQSKEIQDAFISRSIELSEPNYQANVDTEINSVKKYIDFDDFSRTTIINIPTGMFIQFLIESNVKFIQGNLNKIIANYCEFHNLPTDYDSYFHEYEKISPTYEDTSMAGEVDDYFDKFIYTDDEEFNSNCIKYRKIFNDVYAGVFKHQMKFENEHVKIEILSKDIDCTTGNIKIRYVNKDNGKTYEDNIKVENLASYATNYKLFETIFTFKKNI